MRIVKMESGRRIHVLTAEKSMKRKFIGTMAAASGAVPVGRAMDIKRPAPGKIYLPDPVNDPLLVRGVGTNFEAKDFQVGGSLVLPKVDNKAAAAEIQDIKGPEELRLKRPFKGGIAMQQLTGRNDMTEDGTFVNGAHSSIGPAPGYEGTNFEVAPKLDQSGVYDAVHTVLHRGGSIGIFPEGGSHDRTELLPLKGASGHGMTVSVTLILRSRRCHHGPRDRCLQAGMWSEDHPSGHELLSRPQVPIQGGSRIRHSH